MLIKEKIECSDCGHVSFREEIRTGILPDAAMVNPENQEDHISFLEVHDYLESLPEQDYDMLWQSAQGFTRSEIASKLNIPEGSVGRRLVELRLKLAEEFRDRDTI